MATFLNRLPIEIRNQIYEDLLLHKNGSIALNFDGNAIDRWEGDKMCLHTAILRTCKQAYAEGSNVLYGHNRFRYCSTAFLSYFNTANRATPTTSAFKKIKHLEVPRRELKELKIQANQPDSKTLWFIPTHIGAFIHHLAEILLFLKHLGCSLKTLDMKFVFHSGLYDYDFWGARLDSQWILAINRQACEDAFRDIQVATSITIYLDCFDEDLGAMFGDFANTAKFKERWAVKSGFRKTTLRLDKHRGELWDNFEPPGTRIPGWSYDWDSIRYSWTWTLTPTEMEKAKHRPKIPIEEESMR